MSPSLSVSLLLSFSPHPEAGLGLDPTDPAPNPRLRPKVNSNKDSWILLQEWPGSHRIIRRRAGILQKRKQFEVLSVVSELTFEMWSAVAPSTPELTRGNCKSQFHEFTGELTNGSKCRTQLLVEESRVVCTASPHHPEAGSDSDSTPQTRLRSGQPQRFRSGGGPLRILRFPRVGRPFRKLRFLRVGRPW